MSGEWTDYKFTTQENQRKCILPMNTISSTLFYNTRIILSAPIKTPITWHCSKVEQTAPKGISRITFAQENFDEHRDCFEYESYDKEKDELIYEYTSVYDPDKKLIGMWANYHNEYEDAEKPEKVMPKPDKYITLSYSGIKPEIKSGGLYKKLTVTYMDNLEQTIDYEDGTWSFAIDGVEDISELITVLVPNETTVVADLTCNASTDLSENQIKFKFAHRDEFIGKKVVVKFTPTDTLIQPKTLDFEIVPL